MSMDKGHFKSPSISISSSSSPASTTTVRRSRFLLFFVLIVVCILVLRGSPFLGLPEVLKDADNSSLSRANVAEIAKSQSLKGSGKGKQVAEIYGLLHLVTGDKENEHILNHIHSFDPKKPLAMDVYAAGEVNVDWDSEVEDMNIRYPVVVFSKSYCGYSRRAKALLEAYNLMPPPKVIEVDLRDDDLQIKQLLARLTHRSTFPNIIVQGTSIGGSDDLYQLHGEKQLQKILENAGVSVNYKEQS